MTGLNRRHLLQGTAALSLVPAVVASGESVAAPLSPDTGPRQIIRFDDNWRFAFGHASDIARDFGYGAYQYTHAKQGLSGVVASEVKYDDSTWTAVQLPHDWAVDLPFVNNETYVPGGREYEEDEAAAHGYKPVGRKFPETSVGWYRKVFKLDPGDELKRLTLEFDGVFRDSTVFLNGYIINRHESGYTPFEVDISNFINTDDTPNVLLVRVDASYGEGWFYEGAGIYRHVRMVKTNRTYVPQWGVYIKSDISGAVDIETRVASDADKTVTLVSTITDRDGHIVARLETAVALTAQTEQTINQATKLDRPRLWGLDDPHLYTVKTEIVEAGVVVDVFTSTFGVREVVFKVDGFFLNGQPMKIKGTNNHQDHAGVGSAIPDALHIWRLQQLKAMGSNAYRSSHNPATPEVLDACDRMGLLVIDETRLMTSAPEGLAELETLVRRGRNHPSIILWSIGNEEPQQGTARGLKIARDMRRVVKRLDPTRPITAAMNNGQGFGITAALDVLGVNYYVTRLQPVREKFPNLPVVATETASTLCTRGEYERSDTKLYVPAYDTTAPKWGHTAENWWPLYNATPNLLGGFVWTGFDYRGEPTPFNWWPSVTSHFGIMDLCGFPKDNYWYYQAWWSDKPVLHLFPHWNWDVGKVVPVWVHSNCEAVELFVNGKSAGRKDVVKDRHLEWSIPFAPGQITAYGYKGGKVVMKAERRTAGEAARVVLTADTIDDITVLKAELFDAKGIAAPRADNLIHFDVEGPARVIGVGNGNPTSHEPDKATYRKAFNGLAQAIVQRTAGRPGAIQITARSEGLISGRVDLKA
ncbi:beta-galactosidase GalA [Asticcacaulis sp. 201]|uniref:beta-galactosidase GalA n=1 Tax=Asticcacaulis sp. 201 TaxID=3028787 RepID=UPI00291633AB|nr:beta-galactosidase GalA [Asticcacaulis sp. 201]MDV6331473.1 beta-galactosidase GalA [Asticcacaulis sp. 201]